MSARLINIFAFGVLSLLLCGCGNPAHSERQVATQFLAEYLAKEVAPDLVLVVSNPFTQKPGRPAQVYEFEKAGIAGLKKGFGEKTPLAIGFPELKPEVERDPNSIQVDAQSKTPLSFLVSDSAFSKLAADSKAKLIVSLIGLPVNLGSFKEWSQPGYPQFALLLPDWRMIGGEAAILEAFRKRKLLAAVIEKPNVPPDAKLTAGDLRAQFDQRFLLLTDKNIEAILKEHPTAFGLR